MPVRVIAVLAALVGAAVLVAPAGARSTGTVLRIYAKPTGLAFSKTKLFAKAGAVTIAMTNQSVLKHDVAIKGPGVNVKGRVVGKGGVSIATAKLKKGKYEFYCSVPGHEAAGMKGTLVIS